MKTLRVQFRITHVAASMAILFIVVLLATGVDRAGGTYLGAVNGQITFQSTRDGSGGQQVFVMGPNGENPTNISNNDAVTDEQPSFSADGQSIVLTGHPDFTNDSTPSEELYLVNADGTNRRRLTATTTDESQGSISPDGTRIVFTSFVNGSYPELHVMASDGSGRTVMLGATKYSYYSDPKWSPDGSRIAFTLDGDGKASDVCVMVLQTAAVSCLTGDTFDLASQPEWSPDGSRLAFVRDPFVITGQKVASNPDIWVMNADGSGKTRLTVNAWADSQPAWAPNGSRIAFTRRPQGDDGVADDQSGNGEIWVMNTDGSGQKNLTNHPENDREPSWQPLGVFTQAPAFRGKVSVPRVLPVTSSSTPRIAATKRVRFRISRQSSAKLALERRVRGVKVRSGGRTLCRPTTSSRVSRRKRCRAWEPQAWLVRNAKAGRNSISLTGRIDRKALKPGVYRVRAGAVDSIANPARQRVSKVFRVVRR